MNKSIEDIRNEYYYIRQKNLSQYEDKKYEVYDKNPALKKIDDNIIELYISKASHDSNEENEKEFNKTLEELKRCREEYLTKHKIDNSYLNVHYDCEKCKDTGYVDGKKCSCFISKELALFNNVSNFLEIIKNDNFEKINYSYYNQDVETVNGKISYKEYMKNLITDMKYKINNIDKESYNAIFFGATGTGKTFLAHSIGAEFVKKNKLVLCVNVNEYLNSLMPNFVGEPLDTYAIDCDLLIIDDLGTENSTDFTNSKLYYIIDKRLIINKSTIVTTNHTPNELSEKYLEAMVSRLITYTKYWLKGEDLRRIKYAIV